MWALPNYAVVTSRCLVPRYSVLRIPRPSPAEVRSPYIRPFPGLSIYS
jgi:hypothetical protein